ncbi:uncharacterized protein TNIN_120411 [Trichonephila inaurata madagascariensis]|uniref:Uncharacterized protein n=1 Tax=Trichonephila inaurata madagascariensis TaxID=2747483 RepID=A0A8X6XZA4_9ARAC|nr:uncharacterized protein TNIN_120411 [Trichonephila inaurata madagascariensis]
MSGKEEQKNPTSEEPHQLLQPPQGAEGGSESTSTETSPRGSSKKKWMDAFLKYSPTGKSSKTKSKPQVSPKDEQTDIKERASSSSSSMKAFQKFADRARNLAGRKNRGDFKDNLCENEEKEVHEEKESTRKRLSSIPKQVESSIDPSKCKQHKLADSSSVVSMPTSSISLGSSPFSSEPASPEDEVAPSDAET